MGKFKSQHPFYFVARCLFLGFFAWSIAGCATTGDQSIYNEGTAGLSKNNIYPNEQTLLTYALYTRVDLRYEGIEKARFPFLWFEDLPQDQLKLKTEVVRREGIKKVTMVVKKVALFPMQPGDFSIVPGSFKTSFVKGFTQQRIVRDLSPAPITLFVKSFPSSGKPDDFNEFCGDFSMTSHASLIQDNGGDVIENDIEISGYGNIRQLPLPKIDLPPMLHIKDIEETAATEWEGDRVKGKKTFKVKLYPKKPGSFRIPAPHFSYFDATNNRYVSIKGSDQEFKIDKAPTLPSGFDLKNAQGDKIAVLLDVSGSMNAKDFDQEDRISIAKRILETFLANKEMKQNIFGVSLFAKDIKQLWPLAPYQKDHENLLKSAKVGDLPDGTAIGNVILGAVRDLQGAGAGKGKRAILLITDGSLNAGQIDSITAAHFAEKESIPIYTLVIGQGGKVPFIIKDKDFGDRKIEVEVDIDLEMVDAISKLTHGEYVHLKSNADVEPSIKKIIEYFS